MGAIYFAEKAFEIIGRNICCRKGTDTFEIIRRNIFAGKAQILLKLSGEIYFAGKAILRGRFTASFPPPPDVPVKNEIS